MSQIETPSAENEGSEIFQWLLENLPEGVGIAFATLVGAWIAFQLEKWHQGRLEESQQARDGNVALLAILQRINVVASIRTDYLDQHRDSPIRWFKVPAMHIGELPKTLQVETLAFLIDKKNPNLLSELLNNQSSMDAFIGILRLRTDFHNELQEALSSSQIEIPSEISYKQLVQLAGERVVLALKKSTDDLFNLADKTIRLSEEDYPKLLLALSEKLPNQWFPKRLEKVDESA